MGESFQRLRQYEITFCVKGHLKRHAWLQLAADLVEDRRGDAPDPVQYASIYWARLSTSSTLNTLGRQL